MKNYDRREMPWHPGDARAPRVGLKDIRLRVGHCALDSTLGGYYQDIPGALALVEGGYHGAFDEKGVPRNKLAGQWYYQSVVVAQYALALHDSLRSVETADQRTTGERKLHTQLEALGRFIETAGPRRGFAVVDWDDPKYPDLRAGWVSAMYQGNIVSALLRGWQHFGEDRWRDLAGLAFSVMGTPLSEDGVCVREPSPGGEDFWLEEYPMDPPSHVLNGYIYALWGVLDWARVTGDATAWTWWRQGVETLKRRLPEYDCGYWSVYDLRFRELASRYYQENIHVPQMQAMHALTGEAIFDKYAQRWAAQSRSVLCRARWAIMLRVNARLKKQR